MYWCSVNFKSYPVIFSALLLLVIGYTVITYAPAPVMFEPPVFNGSIWSRQVPNNYQTYRAVEGKLSFDEVEMQREFYSGNGKTVRIVKSTLYSLDTGNEVYYLVDEGNKPLTDDRYNWLLDEPKVYMNGNFYRYSGPDGSINNMMYILELTNQPILDLGKRSEDILLDILGENYFRTYFSNPIIWVDESEPDNVYEVAYYYREGISSGRYRDVVLNFNKDKMLVSQVGIPDRGSKQPYGVTMDEARQIALESGFTGNTSSRVYLEPYTQPRNWIYDAEFVPSETYYDQRYCARVVNMTHYTWSVQHRLTERHENPEITLFAIVDVNTGELYVMGEDRIHSISWPDF